MFWFSSGNSVTTNSINAIKRFSAAFAFPPDPDILAVFFMIISASTLIKACPSSLFSPCKQLKESEASKRIPIDQLDDPEIDGNILGYMEDTKEVIVKDVHGNANRNIAVCGGPGTGK